jgi:DNA repair protein RadC
MQSQPFTPSALEIPPAAENRLRATALHDRPQERLRLQGPSALSDAELLAVLLRSGTRGEDVMTMATRMVAEGGSVGALAGWTEARFRAIRGVGRVKALQLVADVELARRLLIAPSGPEPVLDHAAGVAAYLAPITAGLEVEKFWVLCLNRKGRLIRRVEVSSGTASSTLVHPREVFREAIREAASGVICAHNHPSGDPSPSAQDIRITRSLRDAAAAVDIGLIDHVIMGRRESDPHGVGHYSFRAAGSL